MTVLDGTPAAVVNASAALREALMPGAPSPLGATWTGAGVNFTLYSRCAERVELCLYEANGALRASAPLPKRSRDVWHGFVPAPLVAPGDCYAYRVFGPYAPEQGQRCNAAKLLLDPAAREIRGELNWRDCLFDGPGRGELDSAGAVPLARVVDAAFDWGNDRSPSAPWRDTVIYELHVKGYTKLHPAVPPERRGTYLGLAEPAVIDYLRSLGITAVELMPCQAFVTERFLHERGLVNYWGYNPLAWSAPALQYACGEPLREFRQMVKALHAGGLEVIMDVVFNHTAEGDADGPTLSLKGIDNAVYYRLVTEDPARYENYTGCGNTVNAEEPAVQALILDSLRWWAEEMHVDGFRFDLATVLGRDGRGFNRHAALFAALRADPALAYTKLIAEPWDVGPDGYQLGQFPVPWAEWNDRYRDTVRAAWRGEDGVLGRLAERLAGSSDLFRHRGRKPQASINLVTAHDGFTLADLVSYEHRHNEANGEDNRDGHGHNLSWNCGVEGPSDDPGVLALRARQIRNLLATLLLSQGVPMLLAGDEFARTQQGNNNAYCQDNELSWVDWSLCERNGALVEFTRRLLGLRRARPELRRETFLKGGLRAGRAHDVSWWHPAGHEMRDADWHEPGLRSLGVLIASAAGAPGTQPAAGDLLLLVNAAPAALEFRLPPLPDGAAWLAGIDTAAADGRAAPARAAAPVRSVLLADRSLVLYEKQRGA